jgi:hypothetical protein
MTDEEAEAVIDGLSGWERTDFVCGSCYPRGSARDEGADVLWACLDGPLECRYCGRKYPTHIYRGRNLRGDCLVDIDF